MASYTFATIPLLLDTLNSVGTDLIVPLYKKLAWFFVSLFLSLFAVL